MLKDPTGTKLLVTLGLFHPGSAQSGTEQRGRCQRKLRSDTTGASHLEGRPAPSSAGRDPAGPARGLQGAGSWNWGTRRAAVRGLAGQRHRVSHVAAPPARLRADSSRQPCGQGHGELHRNQALQPAPAPAEAREGGGALDRGRRPSPEEEVRPPPGRIHCPRKRDRAGGSMRALALAHGA